MNKVPGKTKNSQKWLSANDVAKKLLITRYRFLNLVSADLFNKPKKYKDHDVWTQDDVKNFLDDCIGKVVEQEKYKKHTVPITWQSVICLLTEKPCSFSNTEISLLLNADEEDTKQLTNLMVKAGAINKKTSENLKHDDSCLFFLDGTYENPFYTNTQD